VVVVDSADDLNRNAANALLKALEEPPRRALILLVSHASGRLLPTIRSRCRLLALSGLDDAVVEEFLARHRQDLGPADRRALARIAEGSIGRAVDLADAGGLELYRSLVGMLTTLPDLDIAALHAFADRVGRGDEEGRAFRTVGELIGWWLARLARGSARGGFLPELIAGEGVVMARLANRRGLDQWALLWEKMARLFARADSANLDRRQVVLTAFLDLAAFARG
jgi:DNA polymerase-3 subunit delta'